MKKELGFRGDNLTLAFVDGKETAPDSLPNMEADLPGLGVKCLSRNGDIAFVEEQSCYFCGATQKGNIYFSVLQADRGNAIDKAVALSRWEPVFQYLESYLNCSIDINPVKAANTDECTHLQFDGEFTDCDDIDGGKLDVFLPIAMLVSRSASPKTPLLSRGVKWHDLSYFFMLDQFFVASAEMKSIQPGSIVLLPASFSDNWCGQLYSGSYVLAADLWGHKINCDILARDSSLRLKTSNAETIVVEYDTASESSDHVDEVSIKVLLKARLRIPANVVVGLQAGAHVEAGDKEHADTADFFEVPFLSNEVIILANGLIYCSGNIVPLAHGKGIVVDRLFHSSE